MKVEKLEGEIREGRGVVGLAAVKTRNPEMDKEPPVPGRPGIELSFFWPLHACDARLLPSLLDEFAEAGADGLCMNPEQMVDMACNAGAVLRWKKLLADSGMRFNDAHARYGQLDCLNCPVPECVPHMLHLHEQSLRLCREFGVPTCTFHLGRHSEWSRDADALHANVLRALEKLLPVAEECRTAICIENLWDPTDSPERLADAVERFRSPWLGVCWDSGHAQLTRGDAPDVPGQPWRESWKAFGFDRPEPGDGALARLLPHVVNCHLHVNDLASDRHWPVDDPRGRTDWASEMPLLLSAPRLLRIQNEASPNAECHFTVRRHVRSLQTLCRTGA